MRGRMNDARSYVPSFGLGEPMTGGAVGQVVASRDERFPEGSWVSHYLGWRELALSNGGGLMRVDPAVAPISTALGVLGMPGLTAYVGLLDIGRLEGRRDGLRLGRRGRGRLGRRTDRQAQGLQGDRLRREPREGGLARGDRLRRGVRLSRGRGPRGLARRHRRVLRQRRRQDARGSARGSAAARSGRRVRRGLAVQRHGASAGAEEPVPRRDEAPAHARLHRLGPRRPDTRRSSPRLVPWLREGSVRYRETVVDGIENAPAAFIGLLAGENIGKMLVRVGGEP